MKRYSAGMRYALVCLLLAAGGAHAQFKCVAPDGAVSYQDAACPGGVPLAALEQRVSFYEPPQFRFDLAWSPRHGWRPRDVSRRHSPRQDYRDAWLPPKRPRQAR